MHSGEANFVLHRSVGPGQNQGTADGLTAGSDGRSVFMLYY